MPARRIKKCECGRGIKIIFCVVAKKSTIAFGEASRMRKLYHDVACDISWETTSLSPACDGQFISEEVVLEHFPSATIQPFLFCFSLKRQSHTRVGHTHTKIPCSVCFAKYMAHFLYYHSLVFRVTKRAPSRAQFSFEFSC